MQTAKTSEEGVKEKLHPGRLSQHSQKLREEDNKFEPSLGI